MVRTILIVDDDPRFRAVARAILAPAFTVVGEATSCREAVTRIRELSPDAVLLDVNLPDGDGFALAATIGAEEDAPAVVLTSSDDLAAEGRPHAGNGFLPKTLLTPGALARLLG